MSRRPQLIVVAGPNGVGKSTYTRRAFATGFLLLDPDRFADTGRNAVGAGRVVIERVRRAVCEREDLVIETTLSGKYPLRVLADAGERGYARGLIYLGIADPSECWRRVRKRVANGGHGVPKLDVLRRYARSLSALPLAIDHTERVTLIDNAADGAFRVIVESQPGELWVDRSIPPWANATVEKLLGRHASL